MKKIFVSLVSFLLLFSLLFSSCAAPSQLDDGKDEPTATVEQDPVKEETKEETLTVETEGTQPANPLDQKDPSLDNSLNILVIGNSFSTGWPDELNGLLKSAGIKAKIYTVYYSGCSLAMHWNWLENGQARYRLRHHKQSGGVSDRDPVDLNTCLSAENWDYISLQQSFHSFTGSDFNETSFRTQTETLAANLFNYIKTYFPYSKLVWFQSWAYEVGWEREGKSVKTQEKQDNMFKLIKEMGDKIATDNNVPLIPNGAAFQIARQNGSGNLSRDGYHDGIETGGQYLNACMWYEFLTGESCVGLTWRPSYGLSDDRMALLQNAAHQATVENTIK